MDLIGLEFNEKKFLWKTIFDSKYSDLILRISRLFLLILIRHLLKKFNFLEKQLFKLQTDFFNENSISSKIWKHIFCKASSP